MERTIRELTQDANNFSDMLRQSQRDNDELRKENRETKESLKFWRNLTLTGLTGLLGILLTILKALGPVIVKNLLK